MDSGQSRRGGLFFFQEEDGIRDVAVTGVQTCALPICFGRRVDDAHAADAARFRVAVKAVHHAVGADGEAAGFLRGRERGIQAAEIGLGNATAMADAAVMASGAAFVDAGENGRTSDGQHAVVEMFGEGVLEIQLDAGQLHGWKEFPVGELPQAFRLPADAGKLFDIVVPRSDVRVADWPVDGDPVFQVGFEIEIAPAVALPSPGDGLAADLAAANPGKMFSRIEGVGIFLVVYEKLVRVFVAGIIALALNRLGALANETIVPVAVPELPDRDVLDVIAFGNDGTPRLENQRVEAFFGELFRGPAAGDSGANNDRERE